MPRWLTMALPCFALGSATILCPTVFAQATIPAPRAESLGAPVRVEINLSHAIGPYKPVYAWFGYDEANYTTTDNGEHLLGELHDLSPVPVSIRAHHLLTSGNGQPELKWSSTDVYHEDAQGRSVYDFKILDGIFDAYMAAGVRPMVELGFMPKDLAATLPNRHEPYQVHYPASTISGASNNPPKDYRRWQELVHAVTAHLVARYGRETILHWPFEVWNEPDIDYWHASPEEYWKLYDFAVAGVRAALPGAEVGGPASTGPGAGPDGNAYQFLDRFLGHVEHDRSSADGGPVPLDFISFHAKGHPAITNGQVVMGLRNELADADRGFDVVSKYPSLTKLPIILSEADPEGCAACSSKVNPANNYRNGTLYPAYTAAAYKALVDLANRRQINLQGMLSWSFEFEGKDYFEGFRSLATNGIEKPVLNLFRMLALMHGERVATESDGAVALDSILTSGVRTAPDIDAMATRTEHEACVLLWNYADAAEPAPGTPTTIILHGLPAGVPRVLLTHYRIDDAHSNAYTAWKDLGSPQQPTAEQYALLKNRQGLELLDSPEWLDVTDGAATVRTIMPRQSVSLSQITW